VKVTGNVFLYGAVDIGFGLAYDPTDVLASAKLVPGDTASTKIFKIFSSLAPAAIKKFKISEPTPTGNQITFGNVPAPAGATAGIVFSAVNTGEANDTFIAKDPPTVAFISWSGTFDSEDAQGNTSQFTAGVFTDEGADTLTLPETAFPNLSPTTIASTFYSLLEPDASTIGILLSLSGSTLNIAYEPEAVTSMGGISFGTTSDIGTITAGINAAIIPEPRPGR
jgi:hypothetical protein